MKVAITGKGGVGKTTLSAALALLFAKENSKVIAVDADPDSNLASTLGFPDPDSIVPLAQMKELISERTGAQPGSFSSYFKLNPKVDDIPEKFCPQYKGIRLLLMGGVRKGGSGCFCPENAFLRSLLSHLFLSRKDVVIVDMEAGIEHLTRGTATNVDALITVVEPNKRSIETSFRINKLAKELKINKLFIAGNKIRNQEDVKFIQQEEISGFDSLGFIRYIENFRDKINLDFLKEAGSIKAKLEARLQEE